MTPLPPEDREWQEFLHKHRPIPPPAQFDLEDQLMKAVEKSPQPSINERLLPWPPALIAGLLMLLSSYRLLIAAPESSRANVETFLQENWNEVVGDTSPKLQSHDVVQVDWRLEMNGAR
jgi:hypothetical protein